MVGRDGSGLRELTSHPAVDKGPRWSSSGDGSAIYFLSPRSESSQIWRIDPRGGEAVQVTSLPVEIDELVEARNDRFIWRWPSIPTARPSPARSPATKPKRSASRAAASDRLFFRHWDTWNDGKRSHLFMWHPATANRAI